MNDESIKLEYGLTDAELLALAFEEFECIDFWYLNPDYSESDFAEPTYRCCGEWTYCFCSPMERAIAKYGLANVADTWRHIDLEPQFGPPAPVACEECECPNRFGCECEPF